MKNSLVNRVKEGAKKAWNKAKPIVLPVIAGVALYGATIQDASGQNKDNQKNVYSYESHNTGASIGKAKIRVKDGRDLEIKVIKGRGEYFQNIPLTIKGFPTNPKKISNADLANTFKDTLNLFSFYEETAQYDLDGYSKAFLQVSSKKPFNWVRARDENGDYLNVIPLSLKKNPKTGKPEIYAEILCDKQRMKRDGVSDDASYITKENLEDILKQLTDNLSTLNLNRKINGQTINTNFYFPSATDSTVYLIPNIEDYTKLRILPATKNEKGVASRIRQVAIVSPLGVYEKIPTDREVIIDNVPSYKTSGTAEGAVADSTIKARSGVKTLIPKEKGNNAYLIFGANGNDKFFEGQFGVQYGPIAFVANYGQGKDEVTLEGTTDPSPVTGRYALMNEENTNMNVKGLALEVHPLHKRKVSPFVGFGVDKWDYTKNSAINIMNTNDQVLTSDTDSKTVSENSYKGYGGLNFKVGDKSQLGVQVRYDNKVKFSGGVRFTQKF